jgi:hypothetical protein
MSAKKEETLLENKSHLPKGESQEFLLGPFNKGDTVRVQVNADEGNSYLMSLHTFDGVTLFSTKVRGGGVVTFRVPAFNEFLKLSLKCTFLQPWVENMDLELVVTVERALEPSPFKGKVCSNCGAPVEPEAKFCWKCGTKLGS